MVVEPSIIYLGVLTEIILYDDLSGDAFIMVVLHGFALIPKGGTLRSF